MPDGAGIESDAKVCARRLREVGLSGWAEGITAAVEQAATGGELVMALRSQLQHLLRARLELPDELRTLAAEIIRRIDRTGW